MSVSIKAGASGEQGSILLNGNEVAQVLPDGLSGLSQSAIVGTMASGAIIERGSNANGEFIRFADGTQICRIREFHSKITTAPLGQVHRAYTDIWNYPASFVEVPTVTANPLAISIWCSVNNNPYPSISGVSITVFGANTLPNSDIYLNIVAIGRWY